MQSLQRGLRSGAHLRAAFRRFDSRGQSSRLYSTRANHARENERTGMQMAAAGGGLAALVYAFGIPNYAYLDAKPHIPESAPATEPAATIAPIELPTYSLEVVDKQQTEETDSAPAPEPESTLEPEPAPIAPSGLPTYSREEVAKHKTKETGIWVTYDGGVYDITEFCEGHPGGKGKIILAAGGPVEPFWKLYAVHKKNHLVDDILKGLRIGSLSVEDQLAVQESAASDSDDPWANQPERSPLLTARSERPYNAEPPTELLVDSFLTPNDLFFVRNHLPVPTKIDPAEYKVEVEVDRPGSDEKITLSFTLDELKEKFPKHSVAAVIQCAGNRRSSMSTVKPVKGLFWGKAAISNAEWTGARLSDVLKAAGVEPGTKGTLKHVQFEGLDRDTEQCYGGSIRIDKALDPDGDVILAYEMNGEPIPADHGFPVRAVVPGIVGARNVKWLSKVVVSENESSSFWQQRDYKGFSPGVDFDTVDYSKAPAIQELPVQSAITNPSAEATIDPEDTEVEVKGYAWSGGGRGIVRVDVSADGGNTWHVAELAPPDQPSGRVWAWTQWTATVPVPEGAEKLELVCKAVDEAYNVQPDSVAAIWNLRGVLANAWDRVPVQKASE